MNSKIKELVGIVFDDIPYSPEIFEAQERIGKALDGEYEGLCRDKSEGEALDELIEKYGRLSQMAKLAGYTDEQAQQWRGMGDAEELKPTKKDIWKQRKRTYIAAAFATLTFGAILTLIVTNAIRLNFYFFFRWYFWQYIHL